MAQSVLPGIERPSYWRRLYSPSPSLSCSQAGNPALVSLLYFPRSDQSMDALKSTHKQGEGLLVLGDLLFGKRIGLYADAKILVSQQVPNTRIAAPLCGDDRVRHSLADKGEGASKRHRGKGVVVPW